MEIIIRIYDRERLLEAKLQSGETCTIGKAAGCTIQLAAACLGKKTITVKTDADSWSVSGAGFRQEKLPYEKSLVLDPDAHLALTAYPCRTKAAVPVPLTGTERLTIGRNADCDIQIADQQISGKHTALFYQDGRWRFQDLKSRNGTYLNMCLAGSGVLADGDVLSIGFCQLRVSGERLFVWSSKAVRVKPAAAPEKRTAVSPDDPYPFCFKPSPRLLEETPCKTLELQAPPTIGGKPNVSWLNILLAPLLSVIVMVAVCLLVTNVMTMLYFSVPTTIIGVVVSILRYRGEKKKYRSQQQLRLDTYSTYLQEQVRELEALRSEQQTVLAHMSPSTDVCIRRAAAVDRELWGRLSRDEDFLSLRVGSGTLPASFSVQAPKQMLRLESDVLAEQPTQIAERFAMVPDCPICVPLGEHLSCGVVGKRARCVALGKNLIVQAAAHHSYCDLRIVVLCEQEETAQWEFCRWLPHCWDEGHTARLIANTPETIRALLERLEPVFSARVAAGQNAGLGAAPRAKPWYLFVCAAPETVTQHAFMKFLTANRRELGISVLYLFDRIDLLPEECHDILDCREAVGVLFERRHASRKQPFQPEQVPQARYEQFARSMAPLRMEAKGAPALPRSVSFLQGYHVSRPSELALDKNWANAEPERSMAVPIGVRGDGTPFLFDIHEKRHGPHGLVAGTTGSGKSEMVQSWILSMAVRFPPDVVSFVLIDFKGTGLLLPFQNLPHLAGRISDLDTSIGRNLIALEYELTRRKELLDRWKVSNISDYRRLLREGKADEQLGYLFIVIDEFAEFKNRFPEFMQAVNRVFAVGRTLGVHMILLTQKPAGVVDDKMNANTRFRWCLKVANAADSREMLHHTDAAQITTPGRAYVQVGEDEVYEQIQSYWSGAPYQPFREAAGQTGGQTAVVDLYGNRHCYEPEKTTGYRSERKEINAVVDYLDRYCRERGVEKARQLWTAKLPEQLRLRDVVCAAFDGAHWETQQQGLRAVIGLLDDPAAQSQRPMSLNFSESGSYAVYGAPATGKTTLLQSAVMSLSLCYSPEQVHLYLMDFGGGSLRLFRELPHVGGIVDGDDAQKQSKLTTMLIDTLDRRKKLLAGQGLVSIDAYREATGEQLPWIVLLLDHVAPALELYPDIDGFLQTLVRDGAACGMYLLVSAGAVNALPYRISQHIKAAVCLRMTDRGDYAQIVGKTNGLEPENLAGRGLVRSTPPLEFQTALPAAGKREIDRVNEIRRLAGLMRGAWTGACPPPIPVLPEVVDWREYPSEQILCGLTEQSVQPCFAALAQEQFLLISCAQDGSSTVQAIFAQAAEKLAPAKHIVFHGAQAQAAAAFDGEIAALMPEMQKRKDASAGSTDWPWILICIDDLKRCIDSINDQTLRRLASILVLGKGLRVAVIVSGNAADITKLFASGERFTMEMTGKTTLLLGGSAQAHMFARTDLAYSAASQDAGAGMGYLVQDGHAVKLKAVQK